MACRRAAQSDEIECRGRQAHSELWDPFTFRTLASIGVAEGWRCLEIGAGTGSVAAWLHQRVGRRGQVVATDIETRWLEPMASTNLVVHHHNVEAGPIADGYDLIHARLVLELPQRHSVARKLAAALCPGGWLVVEDYEIHTRRLTTPPLVAGSIVADREAQLPHPLGSDPTHGSELRTLLLDAGFIDVVTEGYAPASTYQPILVAALGRRPVSSRPRRGG